MTTTTTSTYGECVASLRTSLSFLESSVATLGTGVEDFPRLSLVLKTVRVCFLSLFPSLFSHCPAQPLTACNLQPTTNQPTN